jgi:hypothetical protein
MNENTNPETSSSQARQILAYMQAGHSINPLEALRLFGCFRLGARIKDIEAIIGRSPSRRKIQVKNRGGKAVWVCEYWLEENGRQLELF